MQGSWAEWGSDGPGERAATDGRVHILLIDDSADYLLLIQKALENHDARYRITPASTPDEALALLDEQRFDLVLLDYKFPRGGNGLQVIRALKTKSVFVPTVMVTAFGDEGIAIQAMREGALDFIPKTHGFIQALPEVAARAIERGRIIRDRIRTQHVLARRNVELQVLSDVTSSINVSRDAETILATAEQRLLDLLGATHASVHLLDETGQRLTAHSGVAPGRPEHRVDLAQDAGSLLARAARRCEVLVERDEPTGLDRCVVPLVQAERAIGVLCFTLAPGREISAADGALLASLGKQVGVALEHARLYRQLASTENYLKDLVDNAGDEIVTIDPWGRIMSWNDGAEQVYGYSAAEMAGRDWEILWPADRAAEPKSLARLVMEQGETLRNHETVRVRKDGTPVEILLTLSPLRREDGSLRGVSCVGKDITFNKALQAQLLQAEKMAAVGQLISGVAHELNNPLTGVLGYAQLVSSVETGPKLKQYLTNIAHEAGRCQRIVQNLLSFARKHEPRDTRVDLNDLVRGTLDLRGYDLRVSNIAVETELATNLPATLADDHQLQQVFINIINNAQQAITATGESGRLRLSTRLDPHGLDGGPALVVSFEDDGPGVPVDLRRKIFDPFFTTKGVGKGTGLGLSLSYGIVAQHGGRIDVSEADGGGALFEVRLPVRRPPRHVHAPAAPAPAVLGQKRILVVDDQPTVREVMTDILARDGHHIDSVGDGRQALSRIQEGEEWDLIIVDLCMPDFGGDRLWEEVRRQNPAVANRMMFASGDVVSPETRRFLEGTGRRFLAKPFGIDEVRSSVSSFFAEQA